MIIQLVEADESGRLDGCLCLFLASFFCTYNRDTQLWLALTLFYNDINTPTRKQKLRMIAAILLSLALSALPQASAAIAWGSVETRDWPVTVSHRSNRRKDAEKADTSMLRIRAVRHSYIR